MLECHVASRYGSLHSTNAEYRERINASAVGAAAPECHGPQQQSYAVPEPQGQGIAFVVTARIQAFGQTFPRDGPVRVSIACSNQHGPIHTGASPFILTSRREAIYKHSISSRCIRYMTQWHCKALGDAIMASVPLAQIEEAFKNAFDAAGNQGDAAVFTRAEMEGHLHCEVTVYFSPAASEIAHRFGAVPCAKPRREGMSLLAGGQRCWAVHFA